MQDRDTHSQEVVTHIKNQELVKERRRQIVDAAVKLFIKHEYHKTTTRALAKATGTYGRFAEAVKIINPRNG